MNTDDLSEYFKKRSEKLNEQLDENIGTPAWLDETLQEITSGNKDASFVSRIAILVAVIALVVACISLWRSW